VDTIGLTLVKVVSTTAVYVLVFVTPVVTNVDVIGVVFESVYTVEVALLGGSGADTDRVGEQPDLQDVSVIVLVVKTVTVLPPRVEVTGRMLASKNAYGVSTFLPGQTVSVVNVV